MVRAVDGLSLTLYEGQITCLLGHNGAGKSTTISLLTGMMAPTAGDAIVYGHSLVQELQLVRRRWHPALAQATAPAITPLPRCPFPHYTSTPGVPVYAPSTVQCAYAQPFPQPSFHGCACPSAWVSAPSTTAFCPC